jgi:putative oxidoreductase
VPQVTRVVFRRHEVRRAEDPTCYELGSRRLRSLRRGSRIIRGLHVRSDERMVGGESVMTNDISNEVILAARLLLAALFVIFGWRKLRDYSGTVSQMVHDGAPMPVVAAVVSIFAEFPVALAVVVGAFTRPLALFLAFYTLGTALIAHRFWKLKGADQIANMESFYKNLSIMGGFLLLYISGGGTYSIDAWSSMASP